MKTLRAFLATFVLATLTLSVPAQKPPFHAGQWWKDKPETYREAFVNGFKSGMHHVANRDTELSPFTAAVLTTGVNKFYTDFRNENITVTDALQYVADQLSGVPDEKLKAQILKLRAASAGGPSDE
jgi:hypothetical protein